ncbi:MAG: GDP-mannose 4,6-dehydratase [Candidatus Koribacter versatilis]|uniref:GDP-mannose 4,6-dehydratase n=1 Tax=Candidatus Korobacter versatilis TaxID=658062 RepID=A0A932EP73_9BACT|nr:GDP-mannose 4,6-dehydratase [Candidatus Koribacter versatilis]
MKDRNVLIFGGAGFIGSNWAERLLATSAAKVHLFDDLSRRGVRHNLEWLQRSADPQRLQVTVGDVRDPNAVARAVRNASEIYHLAAQTAVTRSLDDPRHDFDVNLGGTLNVLEAVREAGHRPFLLFTSTNKVYGEMGNRPLVVTRERYRYADGGGVSETQPLDFHSPYGCSKGGAEQYVHDYARSYGIPTVILRMSCVAGPRQFGNEDQGWVAHFLYSAMAGVPVTIYGDGRQVRDVLYVGDLLNAFEAIVEKRGLTEGQIYNVGGGAENTTSLLELVGQIENMTGRRLRYATQPMRPGDQVIYVTDHARLTRETRWHPETSLRETLDAVLDWWTRHRSLLPQAALPQTRVAAKETGFSIPLQELPRTA